MTESGAFECSVPCHHRAARKVGKFIHLFTCWSARSAQTAGPKLTLRFPCVFVRSH